MLTDQAMKNLSGILGPAQHTDSTTTNQNRTAKSIYPDIMKVKAIILIVIGIILLVSILLILIKYKKALYVNRAASHENDCFNIDNGIYRFLPFTKKNKYG